MISVQGTTRPGTRLRRLAGLAVVALVLAGCAAQDWGTRYTNTIDPAVSRSWNLREVRVDVPEALTVSDANSWRPDADIVWHGDPAGDRKLQIAKVLETGVESGAASLKGRKPVVIALTVEQFHAITPRVERYLSNSGVHDIRYVAQVFDARTGAALTPPEVIEADLPALVGEQAREARNRGITQKDEIIPHIAAVTAGWLGIGPDPRGTFERRGR